MRSGNSARISRLGFGCEVSAGLVVDQAAQLPKSTSDDLHLVSQGRLALCARTGWKASRIGATVSLEAMFNQGLTVTMIPRSDDQASEK